jgi:hypothetical protein
MPLKNVERERVKFLFRASKKLEDGKFHLALPIFKTGQCTS